MRTKKIFGPHFLSTEFYAASTDEQRNSVTKPNKYIYIHIIILIYATRHHYYCFHIEPEHLHGLLSFLAVWNCSKQERRWPTRTTLHSGTAQTTHIYVVFRPCRECCSICVWVFPQHHTQRSCLRLPELSGIFIQPWFRSTWRLLWLRRKSWKSNTRRLYIMVLSFSFRLHKTTLLFPFSLFSCCAAELPRVRPCLYGVSAPYRKRCTLQSLSNQQFSVSIQCRATRHQDNISYNPSLLHAFTVSMRMYQ